MQRAFSTAVVISLWYFGIFGATPAPDGWQTYHGPEFTLHLPPGWEELGVGASPAGTQATGRQQVFQFVPAGEHSGDTMVEIRIAEVGKIDPAESEALLDLQNNYPRELALQIEQSVPGRTCSVGPPVYDDARHRLWLRIEASQKDNPPITFFILLLLTEKGVLRIAVVAPAGSPDFEETFREIVNSFELDETLQLQEPEGMSSRFQNSLLQLGFYVGDALGSSRSKRTFVLFMIVLVVIETSALLLLIVDPLILGGRVRASLIRRLQHLPFRGSTGEQVSLLLPETRLRRVPLRWSLALQIALGPFVAFWMAPRFLSFPQYYRLGFIVPCYFLGYALLLLAMILHYILGTSRRLKYELLAAALCALSVPSILGDPWSLADGVGRDAGYILGGYYGLFLSQTFFFLLAGLVVCPLLRAEGDAAARRASTLYWLTHRLKSSMPVLIGVVAAFPTGVGLGCGFACLVASYLVGEKALENPFLYLRSYHDRNTSLVLAKIVLPTAVRFAPVLATAHALQPPEELYRRGNSLTTARLRTLPDAAWREWILTILPHCRAVLIDVSVASASLLWELEHARAILPGERIIVLVEEEAPRIDLPGLTVLRYRLDWRGRWKARRALRRWLKGLRTAPSAAPLLTPPSPEPTMG